MKRRAPHIAKLLAFLLLGAIVNVAVAWGCALWFAPGVTHYMSGAFIFDSTTQSNWHISFSLPDSAGLPFRSMAWNRGYYDYPQSFADMQQNYDNTPAVPSSPILFGFVIDTLFYAGILWLPFGGITYLRGWRGGWRMRRGLCPSCAYPVGTSEVCTECGKPVKKASTDQGITPHTMKRRPVKLVVFRLGIALLWQVVVWILAVGGSFGVIYEVLGIPWNSIGAINVMGTIAGLLILESPLLIAVLVAFCWSRFRPTGEGLCPACAYPVGTSEVCIECGKAVANRTTQTHKANIA